MDNLFIEEPHLEWHHDTPFAIARLNIKYAHLLAKLALKYEPEILKLEVDKYWLKAQEENPTGSRYSSYNTFLLDSSYMPLFLALRKTFRFLLNEIGHKPYPCYVSSWYNIHRQGQNLHRHTHQARFVGSFQAFSEGSTTSYGQLKNSNSEDHIFENRDGILMITKGELKNFHEVSKWNDSQNPRVSYAFDIIEQFQWRKNRNYIPFDGY